jgi:RNA-directed DNA polymerase
MPWCGRTDAMFNADGMHVRDVRRGHRKLVITVETHSDAQGGILSPLLTNIALSALDDHFDGQWRTEMADWHQRDRRRRSGQGCWKLIRYADDFVVVVSGQRQHAEALRGQAAQLIAPLGLRLAPEKTRVVGIDEGFDFLGFHIRRMRKRGTNKHYVYTVPSRKAIAVMRVKVSTASYRSTLRQDLDQLLRQLNRMLIGWANYFRRGVSMVQPTPTLAACRRACLSTSRPNVPPVQSGV